MYLFIITEVHPFFINCWVLSTIILLTLTVPIRGKENDTVPLLIPPMLVHAPTKTPIESAKSRALVP